MHDHENFEHLTSYADVLAGELPGSWTSTHHPVDDKNELDDLADRIWDLDVVAESLAEHELRQAAVLTRSDGAQLVVLDVHGSDEFLIAAVAPRNLPDEAYRRVREPNGFTLAEDPFQAAEQVNGRLLARYDTALARVRYNAVGDVQPSQKDHVVLTWQKDGSLATVEVGESAADILMAAGFVRDGAAVYRLSGDDFAVQARAVRKVGRQLAAHNISTSIQFPSGRVAPTATAPAARPAPAGLRPTATRAR